MYFASHPQFKSMQVRVPKVLDYPMFFQPAQFEANKSCLPTLLYTVSFGVLDIGGAYWMQLGEQPP
jgi:hypothetical protein